MIWPRYITAIRSASATISSSLATFPATSTWAISPVDRLLPSLAAPMRNGRLLMIRATAVLTASVLIAAVGALALPWRGLEALAWLLPSLGLTLTALALSTVVRHRVAVALVIGALSVAAVLQWSSGDRFAVFRPGAQVAFVVLICISVWVLARRRETFEEGAFR